MIWKAIAIAAIWFAPALPSIIAALNKSSYDETNVFMRYVLQLIATGAVVLS